MGKGRLDESKKNDIIIAFLFIHIYIYIFFFKLQQQCNNIFFEKCKNNHPPLSLLFLPSPVVPPVPKTASIAGIVKAYHMLSLTRWCLMWWDLTRPMKEEGRDVT